MKPGLVIEWFHAREYGDDAKVRDLDLADWGMFKRWLKHTRPKVDAGKVPPSYWKLICDSLERNGNEV